MGVVHTWVYHCRVYWEYRLGCMAVAHCILCFDRWLSGTANSLAVHECLHIDYSPRKAVPNKCSSIINARFYSLNWVFFRFNSEFTLIGGLGGPCGSVIRTSNALHLVLYWLTLCCNFAMRAAWFCWACFDESKRSRSSWFSRRNILESANDVDECFGEKLAITLFGAADAVAPLSKRFRRNDRSNGFPLLSPKSIGCFALRPN